MVPETYHRKMRSELANAPMLSVFRMEQAAQCRDKVPETVICER